MTKKDNEDKKYSAEDKHMEAYKKSCSDYDAESDHCYMFDIDEPICESCSAHSKFS